jgi:hypothetical protein
VKSSFLLFLAGLVLSGCGTVHSIVGGTPYQPYNSVIGGYSETQLASDMVRVVFRGNSSTSKERAQDIALLRAAELSLQAGFPYFAVVKEDDETKQSTSGDLTIYMPRSAILVRFLKEKPADGLNFDAEFLSRTLREKYEVK